MTQSREFILATAGGVYFYSEGEKGGGNDLVFTNDMTGSCISTYFV